MNNLIDRANDDEWKGELANRYLNWTEINLDDASQRNKINLSDKTYNAIKNDEIILLEDASTDKSYPE